MEPQSDELRDELLDTAAGPQEMLPGQLHRVIREIKGGLHCGPAIRRINLPAIEDAGWCIGEMQTQVGVNDDKVVENAVPHADCYN